MFGKFRIAIPLCCISLILQGGLFGKEPAPLFRLEGFWSASVKANRDLANRLDLRLGFPRPNLDFRGQLLDKRAFPYFVEGSGGIPALSAGIYHKGTGSRFLYGILDQQGLAARIRKPWIRGMPYVEAHSASSADLKTEFSSTGEARFYTLLATPRFGPFSAFAAALSDTGGLPSLTGGINLFFTKGYNLRLEGFYKEMTLPAYDPESWFSDRPPLPERDFRIYAGSAGFSGSGFALAGDLALSESFAWGRGLYGNLGLRFGDRPWRFSLGADAASPRFVGSDGDSVGAGLRSAGKIEYRGKRSALFRAEARLTASALELPFTKNTLSFYYRFPASREEPIFRLHRLSLSLQRELIEASSPADNAAVSDGADLSAAFDIWRFRSTLKSGLSWLGVFGRGPFPWPDPAEDFSFESASLSTELSWKWKRLTLAGKFAYGFMGKKEDTRDLTLSASFLGKWSRAGFKVLIPRNPKDWAFTLSWRLRGGFSV